MNTLQRVLVPTDFSECAQQAAAYARQFAAGTGAEIHLLHVIEPWLAAPTLGDSLPAAFVAELDQHAEEEMQQWKTSSDWSGFEVTGSIEYGSPFVEIVRYARDQAVDLIVIGTHGRSGVVHALIGSVAEKVVRKAPCPVLTIRPEGYQFSMP